MDQAEALPIAGIRTELLARRGTAPIVISAPTGTGKSTEVPRYLPGRTLVVEPRRVACRGLAQRVATLEGSELGGAVGYRVRDDDQSTRDTRILFATPGVALRMFDGLSSFDQVVLDEFHERGMETDLLLALLLRDMPERLIVMSATLEAERLRAHLGGHLLEVGTRSHPIDIRYQAERAARPDPRELAPRMVRALRSDPVRAFGGDVLVFLPGKAEIAAVHAELSGRGADADLLVPLHGGLSLKAQARIFEPSARRKVILATNVAETSLTVPGVKVVIDSGLVRRTRYHNGRSYLALNAIAQDSATQRAGRAGRLGPGLCLRLWGEAAQLDPVTPPELHREALDQLWLAAALCGASLTELPFLDPPKPHAVEAAVADLRALGAIDQHATVTPVGRSLFGLPLDPALGRLLIEAKTTDCLDDAIDLVACLSLGRPLFERPLLDHDPLGAGFCDVTGLINGLRHRGDASEVGIAAAALGDARRAASRLRAAFGLPAQGPTTPLRDRRRLAETALAADPRCAHVVRTRKGTLALANGGTELALARESRLGLAKAPEAALVFDTRGVGDAHLRARLLATCCMPIDPALIVAAGLARPRMAACKLKRGRLLAQVEHVFAKRVLACDEETPEGELAREAIAELLEAGRLFGGERDARAARLEALSLAHRVKARLQAAQVDITDLPPLPPSTRAYWVARLHALGVESGDDLSLLSPEDVAGPELPYPIATYLAETFPLRVSLGDADYRVEYDFAKRRATLLLTRGQRATPPSKGFLPRLGGLTIFVEAGGRLHRID